MPTTTITAPLVGWPPYDRAHRALHWLWSGAVGTRGYDKARWKALERSINELALLARDKTTEDAPPEL